MLCLQRCPVIQVIHLHHENEKCNSQGKIKRKHNIGTCKFPKNKSCLEN
uniref:Uncharacterized protein n=1 Tax=Arundo donax TaxID=35708 RepID=A0A0A9FM94_ARUDO